MREIDATQWQEVAGGWSGSGAAPGWRRRSPVEPAAERAWPAAEPLGGRDAPGAAPGRSGADTGGAAEGGQPGMREPLPWPAGGRRPGLLMFELPEQDKLGLE